MMNMVEAQKQTFGVEIEMNNITRREAAKLAAEFFGTGRFEDTARRNGYCTWSAWMADGREFKFQKDVSIAGPDSHKCEMVTPILTYEDMETLQERMNDMIAFLDEMPTMLTEYSDVITRRLVEKITIYDEKIVVELKSGLQMEVEA